ncbi:MAG: DUF4907 domain-containing protein [Siphonobacter aquaeclarae]|nr:DUF4907 domain-containing protein [Siphonobacter aquaeclarae]
MSKKKVVLVLLILIAAVAGYLWKSGRFEPRFRLQVFQTPDGWGFEIAQRGRPFIYQPIIPTIPGKRGFSSEEGARKTGELMIKKLEESNNPPEISVEELRELGIPEAAQAP